MAPRVITPHFSDKGEVDGSNPSGPTDQGTSSVRVFSDLLQRFLRSAESASR